MFNLFKRKKEEPVIEKKSVAKKSTTPRKSTPRKKAAPAPIVEEPVVQKKTPKELATERGDPYVAILSMDVDPNNLHQGSFELDWNDKFIANLIRAGYQGKTDADLVDQWFQAVCRNVLLETWEQEQAIIDGSQLQPRINVRDIGNGRTEVS